ncbi:MAG: ribosome biogenesis GTP-binding protein YihA/YsxC [Pseudomonadales bacterium]|jgi:GTP-binding protein|nr:ribosome biogenesis GTP-binding protein YihA/YsxC [Pseudomonadales bacterium]MDP6471449.1 ribosome biogenesis GTP-binding protein YihA/YsxC [Pseudomonadales bacterium]MDP6828618.1 ribosome biogenesis GTP-binding protein YihA/YsxC [Pseudomonadales bacterium]MDP6972337.1 ribosome biogenesis GTP-binding protein YihA/YsxC [Pseudomonadales bacterium]|tara:strand:+ start:1240 stop:1869 length:630 start_codon:yes stop_codon:yes gene_type:complete
MEEKSPDRLVASFLVSAPSLNEAPAAAGPEIAFAGRSNAGKSSTLNRLTGNRNTAKVSKTPGRTQLLNFFEVHPHGRIVDLPGYGYARAKRKAQNAWQRAVNEYLSYRDCLAGVVLVTDIRHPGQRLDGELIAWAHASGIPLHVLLNKADKLKYGQRQQALAKARKALQGRQGVTVQLFSATSGEGVDTLLEVLRTWFDSERSPPEQAG